MESAAAVGCDLTSRFRDDERVKAQAAVRVVVDEHEEWGGDRGHEPRLFAQLAERRVGGLLAVVDRAAGKLPRAGQVLGLRTAGDEDQSSAHDDRQGDVEADSGVGDQAGAPEAAGL